MTKSIYILVQFLLLTFCFNSYNYGNCNHPELEIDEGVAVVVLDPGHGGKDPGASFGNALEKNIVLDIALILGDSIKNKFPDIKVVYTRSTDKFIPLYKRAEIANKNEADLFISLHVNSVDQTSVKGAETFILGNHRTDENLNVAVKENAVILLEDDYNTAYEGFDPNDAVSYIMFSNMQEEYLEQSLLFASDIQEQIKTKAKRVDRSVKQAGFLVLRRTTMPGVLVEAGFISNPSERIFMTSKAGRTSLANAIFSAFKAYKERIESQSSFHVVTENKNEKILTLPKANREIEAPVIKTEAPVVHTAKKIEISEEKQKKPETSNLFYSVQILALKRKLEPNASNFKNEENIFRVSDQKLNRYFSGKYKSIADAEKEQKRIVKKYPGAFVVGFKNNQLISVKKNN